MLVTSDMKGDTMTHNTVQRRFLLDNDGSNLFWHLSDDIEQDIRETVEECPENVTTYLLCAAAGTMYYPTKVGTVVPVAKRLCDAHAAGVDPFGMLIDGLRGAGKEVFATLRMNDVHNPDAADEWNLPQVRRDHPDCIVDADAVARGEGGWMAYCIDYSREEVRSYMLAVIEEIAGQYDLDGLQLDWMRFPRHLSGTPDEVWANRDILTEFTSDAAEILRKRGMLLAARVPTSLAGCRYLGIDLAEWTQRGLTDFLVASPFLTTDNDPPLKEMKDSFTNPTTSAQRTPLGVDTPLYGAFEFNHAMQSHCPESLRATCTSLYEAGADGIYAFNFPCWTERIGVTPYDWLNGLDEPVTACSKPLLYSVTHEAHRVANVDLTGQLPVTIEAKVARQTKVVRQTDATCTVTLPLPKVALSDLRRVMLLVRSTGDVTVSVNATPCGEPISDKPMLFMELEDTEPDTAMTTAIYRVDTGTMRPGENTIEITNDDAQPVVVDRVNIGLW
jgi:hypothetical protein